MTKTIWFDMDGTIADLYNVNNWLAMLRAYDATPYIQAKPMLNMSRLARLLHKAQARGWRVGIVSWLSKEPTASYDIEVTQAKASWLKKHLPSVKWDEIQIVAHGTPKQNFATSSYDILFDDEEKNRLTWTGKAYEPNQIYEILLNI